MVHLCWYRILWSFNLHISVLRRFTGAISPPALERMGGGLPSPSHSGAGIPDERFVQRSKTLQRGQRSGRGGQPQGGYGAVPERVPAGRLKKADHYDV